MSPLFFMALPTSLPFKESAPSNQKKTVYEINDFENKVF